MPYKFKIANSFASSITQNRNNPFASAYIQHLRAEHRLSHRLCLRNEKKLGSVVEFFNSLKWFRRTVANSHLELPSAHSWQSHPLYQLYKSGIIPRCCSPPCRERACSRVAGEADKAVTQQAIVVQSSAL